MTINRPSPKDLGRLAWEKHINCHPGQITADGADRDPVPAEVVFLFYTDRDMVMDEAILFIGEQYATTPNADVVNASLRYRTAVFDTAITNAELVSTWTNVLVTATIGQDSGAIAKKAHLLIGPDDAAAFIPAGSFVGLALVDEGDPTTAVPWPNITNTVLQLRGYYPKSGNA